MYPISFPNLHLTFEINPIAIEFGNIHIYWYGILIVFSILLGLAICKKQNGTFHISFDDAFDYLFFAVLFGIICARAYYVLFHFDFYLQNPLEILKVYHRWSCNLWRNYWCCCSCCNILQKEKDCFLRFNGLRSSVSIVRTINW